MTTALLMPRPQFSLLCITAALLLTACGRDPAVGHEPAPTGLASAHRPSSTASSGAAATSSAAPTSSVAAPTATSTASSNAPAWLKAAVFSSSEQVDVLIHGGTVIDGTGAAGAIADVVIHKGRIAHVGRTAAELTAKWRVDASGKVVSPGFIDTHSHGDPANADHDIVQGVTTICVGQDGFSALGKPVGQWIAKLSGRHLRINAAPFFSSSHCSSIGIIIITTQII